MTGEIADPLLTTAKFQVEQVHASLVFSHPTRQIQRVIPPEKIFTPYHALLNCTATPTFRPHFADHSGFLTFNILLMEGEWSRSDCGQLGHWVEVDDSHLFLSLPEAVQYLYFLNISGQRSTPCGPFWQCRENGSYDVWYSCKWWWQIDVMLKSLTARGLWGGRKTARCPARMFSGNFWIAFSPYCVLIVIWSYMTWINTVRKSNEQFRMKEEKDGGVK